MLDHIYEISYIKSMMTADSLFNALSNPIRLRCILLMQAQGELCVCELTYALALSQPMISRHLAVLKESGLVTDRREGQWVYYQINQKLPQWINSVMQTTATENIENEPFANDLDNLSQMPNRPGSVCCA